MLKPKNIKASTGAENLAGMMIDYLRDVNAHYIQLDELHDAPAEWNFFRPLPEGKFFELVESIAVNGLLTPLIVWERPAEVGGYTILSGHNRARALRLLFQRTGEEGYRSAACVVHRSAALTEEEAQAIIIDCNWIQRTLSTSEKARAIYAKYVELGRMERGTGQRRYDVVAERFGLKATQVYNYYRLASLDEWWLDQIDAGKLSIKAAVHLSGLTEEQRGTLRQWPGLTQKQILSVGKDMSIEEIRATLAPGTPAMKEIRMLVPANRYEEIMLHMRVWIDSTR